MNLMKPGKQLFFRFQAILAMVLLLMLAVNVTAVAQSLSILSTSILPDDRVEVNYDFEGNIESLELRYYPDLTDFSSYEDFTLSEPFDGQAVLNNPAGAERLNLRLIARIDGGWIQTDIHSSIYFEEIVSTSEGCDIAVDAWWINYVIYTTIDPPAPPKPLPFDSLALLMYNYDETAGQCMLDTKELIFSEAQSYADRQELISLPTGIAPDKKYCFRIRSYASDGSSPEAYSNMMTGVQISDIITPKNIQIVSVDIGESIVVRGKTTDTEVSDFIFELFRSSDETVMPDEPIVSVPDPEWPDFEIEDTEADINHGPYFYRLKSLLKDCEEMSVSSETVPSVFLFYDSFDIDQDQIEVVFQWNHYSFFDSYTDARLLVNDQSAHINFPDQHYVFTLPVSESGTTFSAGIEAKDAMGNKVRSNTIVFGVDILDRKNIPNALRPDSHISENRIFILPFLITNTSDIEYNISIIDKNGQEVFRYDGYYHESDSAWNGQIMNTGPDAPAGAYVYELEYGIPGSPPETKRGVVYLIR